MAKKEAKKKSTRRPTIPVEVSADVEAIIKRECDGVGMSRKVFAEKLIKWFAAQNDVVRATILETIPESLRSDVARIALEQAASTKPASRIDRPS